MKCRNCGAALEADRIDRRLGVVSCAHCGGLHALATASGAAAADAVAAGEGGALAAPAERPVAPRPRGFEVRGEGGAREIRWREGSAVSGIVLAAFAVAWVAMTVSGGFLVATPVALLILYYAAVRAFNRNRLRVDGARLELDRGPLPWPGGKRVPRAEIAQVFARETLSRVHGQDDGRRQVQVRRRYRVAAMTPDGRRLRLVGGLDTPDQALWLEQEIERTLGIDDRAVAGAYRG